MPASPSRRTIASPIPLDAPVINADVNGYVEAMLSRLRRRRSCRPDAVRQWDAGAGGGDAAGGVEAGVGPAQRGLGLGIVFVAQRRLGALRWRPMARARSISSPSSAMSLRMLTLLLPTCTKPPCTATSSCAAVGQRDAGVVLGERTEKRGVTRQEGDLATAKGARDHLRRLTGEDDLLG